MSAFYQRVKASCTVNMSPNPVGCSEKANYRLPDDIRDVTPPPPDPVSWLEDQAKKACQEACGGALVNALRRHDADGNYFLLSCGDLALAADPSRSGIA